ncbi:MAG: response regulator, partial [Candidatus Binatia bacterium]
MPGPITVIIADDHAIFRQALRLTLTHRGTGITVADEAENGEDAIRAVERHQPDILLLDLGLPKRTTRDILRDVHVVSPDTGVIILTGFADLESVTIAAQGGARGFVLKRGPLEPLLEAIRRVALGEVWADSMLTVSAHNEFVRIAGGDVDGAQDLLKVLSRRELEVIGLVAEGFSNRDIASKLSISEKTVISHMNHVFGKLGVSSRLQAA